MKIDLDTKSRPLSDVTSYEAPMLEQTTAMVTTPVIAQQFEDVFFSNSGEILGNFVESGQLWALLIGIAIGYVVRGITTY